MQHYKLLILAGFTSLLMACLSKQETRPVEIIPEPMAMTINKGSAFELNESTPIVINDSLALPAVSQLQFIIGQPLQVQWNTNTKQPGIHFLLDASLDSLTHEGYSLQITKDQVEIKSAGPQGLFYAVESIRQLLPPDMQASSPDYALPQLQIIDQPRFQWRGMHLDVSRHFMPTAFIKKYIDYLAMHKLNVFHWHLVDGIGWRIEIKSHPLLTEIGAWRKVKPDRQPWQDFEVWRDGDSEAKYGGFYTQEEIKEVVAYAQERFITVIPEIELPGHSEVVMQCYPELICKDQKGHSLKNHGVYCASNPESYQLLEDVLDEVLELFPSEYIHIGGDEVGKSNWKNCAGCQRLMRQKGYDAHELQSHFVNHFDEYLKSKGRKLMGWHEILEGQLSPSASIMYWGSEKGVADCLKKGHPTVLTTGSHLYFDHYQSLSKQEPKAFGGYAPLKKVYDYEPVPEGLDASVTNQILGVQANIWTEYMPNEKQVEYMLFPRLAALSEIAWQQQGTKDWSSFRTKMNTMLERYDAMDINYAYSALRPSIHFELNKETRKVKVSLETELQTDIYYTTDGTEPAPETATLYQAPFELDQSATVKAIAVKNGKVTGLPEVKEAILHKARGAQLVLNSKPYGKYSAQGGYTLVDADFGGDKWGNGKWVGILSEDLEATLTLDQPTKIHQIGLSCIEETGAGIYFPAGLEVLISEDGKNYRSLKQWRSDRSGVIPKTSDIQTKVFTLEFAPVTTQYLKIKAPYQHVKDQGVFIFTDELIVE